ncbi:Cof-type HAD-IIB family hydrolase [Lacticaseibacillus hulanensis]|uniref:Cof-type HAD-IIB family hydrolase n=1 Tax=Lacticaseibacillus hulanensis TaxID=2493111 RepID=UPI000FD6DABF|nr:HAD family hydrolase [Lacticaseibacillus hulanensis]
MYKLLVSDLDETLVRADGSISPENAAAIREVVARGIKFVPNTGRGFASVQELLKAIGTYQQPGQYVISYNGGAVIENKDNQVLATGQMPYADAKQIFDILATHPEVDVHVYTLNHLYIYNERPDDLDYVASRGVVYNKMPDTDFTRFAHKHIMKVIFMNPDIDIRHRVAEEVKAVMGDKVDLTYSSARYGEFNHHGVNKGSATLQLADKLGIKPDEIMAFGDNANDIPMLKVVGMPVSVSNGIPDVKALAKYVTAANYQTGVAEAIHKFILDK